MEIDIVQACMAAVPSILSGIVLFEYRRQSVKADEKAEVQGKEELARKEEHRALVKGVRTLLRSKLRSIHEKAVRRGYITYEELQDAEDNYSSYHGMGGNGRGTDLIKDIRDIPVKGGPRVED